MKNSKYILFLTGILAIDFNGQVCEATEMYSLYRNEMDSNAPTLFSQQQGGSQNNADDINADDINADDINADDINADDIPFDSNNPKLFQTIKELYHINNKLSTIQSQLNRLQEVVSTESTIEHLSNTVFKDDQRYLSNNQSLYNLYKDISRLQGDKCGLMQEKNRILGLIYNTIEGKAPTIKILSVIVGSAVGFTIGYPISSWIAKKVTTPWLSRSAALVVPIITTIIGSSVTYFLVVNQLNILDFKNTLLPQGRS